MSGEPIYSKEFLKSPHHLVLGLCTIGLGFLAADLMMFLAGLVGYVFGWIWLPGMPFFKRWVDKKYEGARLEAEQRQLAEFNAQRQLQLDSLSEGRQERYNELVSVCDDIERTTVENMGATITESDPRLQKLDELMWTFLRLLKVDQTIEQFVGSEQDDEIRRSLARAEDEIESVQKAVEAATAAGDQPLADAKGRLLNSTRDRLEVLKKRLDRYKQASTNIEVVRSELSRLEEQIKLLRADAMATRNADALSMRIDASVQTLNDTNKMLSDMSEFTDLASNVPIVASRIGFRVGASATAPDMDVYETPRSRKRGRQCVRN